MAQHRHFVYTMCLNHVGQATEAEDLTQEVFVHGSHDLAQLREPAQVLRGVRQVARNCPHTGAIATLCRPGSAPTRQPILAASYGDRHPLVFKSMDGQPDADRHQPGRKDEADAAP
jgi:hypothetical protein